MWPKGHIPPAKTEGFHTKGGGFHGAPNGAKGEGFHPQNKSYPGHAEIPFTIFCMVFDKLNAKPSFAGRVLTTAA